MEDSRRMGGGPQAARTADAASRWPGWLALLGIAAVVFALDQWTKELVLQNLAPMGPGYHIPILGQYLKLEYTTNTGAAFGLFSDRTMILTVVALAAIPLLLLGQNFLPISGWQSKICVGLLLGGTIGNLADRLRQGFVVDFVAAGVNNLRWPSFNVADSSFVVGILLLLVLVLLHPEPGTKRDGG